MKLKKRVRHWLQYVFMRLLLFILAAPPRPWALKLAAGAGQLAFLLLARHRKLTVENLTRVFGREKSPAEIQQLARQCFIHLAKNGVDVARFPKMTKADFDRLVTIDGLDKFDAAFQQGKGLVVLTGHIGNWEFMAAWFALQGYPVSVVGRRLPNVLLNRLLLASRESKGLKYIDREDSARGLLRVLRNGEIVGVLIDQDTKVENVVVNFFGHPARTPVGLARLVLRTGSIVVPLVINRRSDETYHITVGASVYPTPDTANMDATALTQTFNNALEKMILLDPPQWVWMHKRWRVTNENNSNAPGG